MTLGEEVVEDYVAMRLTLRAHPMALLRHLLTPDRGPPVGMRDMGTATVAGAFRGTGRVMLVDGRACEQASD